MRSCLLALLLLSNPVVAGEPRDSAVKVTGTGISASGVVVGRDGNRSLVVTNRHVCPASAPGLWVHHGGRVYPAAWVGADPADDLALLSVEGDLPAAELADALPAAGTALRQWGFPRGGPQAPKGGPAVGSVRVFDKQAGAEIDVWVSDFAPETGDSGSGQFDPDGRLVAVTFARTDEGKCHAVPAGRVRAFLKGLAGKGPAAATPAKAEPTGATATATPMKAEAKADPAAPPPPGPPPGPNYEWKKLPGVGGSYDGYGWVERGRTQGD